MFSSHSHGKRSRIFKQIYRAEGTLAFELLVSVTWSDREFNDTGLEMGSNYTYYLTALSLKGESAPTHSLRVMIPGNGTGDPMNVVPEEEKRYDAYIIGAVFFAFILLASILVSLNMDKLRNIKAPLDRMVLDEDSIDSEQGPYLP
ncbi:MAG: fibronectin type III domain-containing protein [Candidatus Thermoplasmatota archaeon]|nr:fibronectin type III domain-containing protein [Candidatus Thermoplasmatota archaeon]